MQTIRLMKLQVSNFKGIKDLSIDFNGKDYNVKGANGTGKTTVIDAFTWLLFGKDSLGRADFGIKPTDTAGNEIHNLECTVEATFNIDGTERTFKRVLQEVWTRKRGAKDAEFTKNETKFYVDGVPKKKTEYATEIKAFIDEKVFKILTDPLCFNEAINWKERRITLLEICGDVPDTEVIASKLELSPLPAILNGKTVEDFKAVTTATMKRINDDLELIPVKINEAEMAKPSAEQMEADTARKDELTMQIAELQERKSFVQNGGHIANARHHRAELQAKLKAVGTDFIVANTPEHQHLIEVKAQKTDLQDKQIALKTELSAISNRVTGKKQEQGRLSAEWDKVSAERFTGAVCPTCKRELPAEDVEALKKDFNYKKAVKLDEIETQNSALKKIIEASMDEYVAVSEKFDEVAEALAKIDSDIAEAEQAVKSIVKAKAQQHSDERMAIMQEIETVEESICNYEADNGDLIKELEENIEKLSKEKASIDEAEANRALMEKQNSRIAELMAEQNRLAVEYNKAESHMYIAEMFTVAKVNMLNERINEKFKFAKFKLFDKQINGGINEVCEVTYNGIPYKDLNNAMRINIGLDVINTISEHYGVAVPIFIDNAESVNELFHTNAQQIRMYVSNDKELTFEAE